MVAGAIVALVGLQLDFRRQLEIAERLGERDRVDRLLLIGDARERVNRRIAEPIARGRNLAVVDLADVGDEFIHPGNARLFPVPFEHPNPDARFRRHRLERFEFLLKAGDVNLLVEPELHDLLEAVDHVRALRQHHDDVGARSLRLDEVGGEIRGAQRREFVAGHRAAELRQVNRRRLLQRMAESVVGRDEMPFLAVLLEQQAANRIRLHGGGVAHPVDVPFAVGASDRVGVAARDDVKNFLLIADLGDCLSDPRVDVADQEGHLIAVDQLARLLHAGADVVGGILDQQLERAPENSAGGVDLIDRELGADHFVLRHRRVDAGQRIDHADPDRRIRARRNHEGRRYAQGAEPGSAFENRTAVESTRRIRRRHGLSSLNLLFAIFGAAVGRRLRVA